MMPRRAAATDWNVTSTAARRSPALVRSIRAAAHVDGGRK
jgi:hypothetical protein